MTQAEFNAFLSNLTLNVTVRSLGWNGDHTTVQVQIIDQEGEILLQAEDYLPDQN